MSRHERLRRVAADPLARLRRLRGEDAPTDSKVRKAARNFVATADGQTLINWMLAQSYERALPTDASESALRENEARKRFLDQFLALAEEPRARTTASPSQRRRPRK